MIDGIASGMVSLPHLVHPELGRVRSDGSKKAGEASLIYVKRPKWAAKVGKTEQWIRAARGDRGRSGRTADIQSTDISFHLKNRLTPRDDQFINF